MLVEHATAQVAAIREIRFYLALAAAQKADMLFDFSKQIRANEPLLSMNEHMLSWNVAEGRCSSESRRLNLYTGRSSMELLAYYFRRAQHRPATALIKASVRYIELGDMPYVRDSSSRSFRVSLTPYSLN